MDLDAFLKQIHELISEARAYDAGDVCFDIDEERDAAEAYAARAKALRLWIAQYGTAE